MGSRRGVARRNPYEPDALAGVGAADRGERGRRPHLAHQDRHRSADPAAGAPAAPGRGDRDARPDQRRQADFGVGRSAFPRAYNAYGISYEESQDRFSESLDIIKLAWTEPVCSYQGRYHSF